MARRIMFMAVVAVLALAGASPVAAQTYGPQQQSCPATVTDATPTQGAPITVRVSECAQGFQPDTPVGIFLAGRQIGTDQVDSDGSVNARVTIPSDAPVGQQTLAVRGTGVDGQPFSASTQVEVLGATATRGDAPRADARQAAPAAQRAGTLPRTGSDNGEDLVRTGVSALVLGAGLVLLARNRRSRRAAA